MDNIYIQQNVSLKQYTSMYVGGLARYFVEVVSVYEFLRALQFAKERKLKLFVIGGGSNIIVSDKGFDGLVIRMRILGKKLLEETEEYILYEVGSGEVWDDLVRFSVEYNLYGIENISHVPGTVGASVVQNVGCYGQEVSESVVSVMAIDKDSLEQVTLQNSDLHFSYRKSRLNDPKEDKGKYIVTSVIFRLQKKGKLMMKYDDIKKYFAFHSDLEPKLKTMREAIIKIRDSKFPFPDSPKNGTVGSFWNAEPVDETTYEKIIRTLQEKGFTAKAEEMVNKKSVFAVAQGFKVPYGLFVEVLCLRGKSLGGAKILENHGGIINNFTGEATAQDVFSLSKEVIQRVYDEFGVRMKVEPELVGDFQVF